LLARLRKFFDHRMINSLGRQICGTTVDDQFTNSLEVALCFAVLVTCGLSHLCLIHSRVTRAKTRKSRKMKIQKCILWSRDLYRNPFFPMGCAMSVGVRILIGRILSGDTLFLKL